MIGRCDRCDKRHVKAGFGLSAHGVRWDPGKAPLKHWRCPECGGPIRAKRKGESEPVILTGKLAKGIVRA